MRKLILAAVLLTFSTTASAETILASVNGMVCAFCATGIEKTFKKQAAVESVKVDLESKLVTLKTKDGKTMADDLIRKLIAAAGYTVTAIERK